jgi:hypothetical protein
VTPGPDPQNTRSQRWLARLSFVLACLATTILVVFVGLKSLVMLSVALACAAVSLAAAYIFSSRGVVHWLRLAVLILAPIAVIVVYAFGTLVRVAIASAAAWLLASVTARRALVGAERTGACPSTRPRPPRSDMRAISRSSELASAQYTSMIQYPVQVDR